MSAPPEAVEAARVTGHARLLALCDPDHPDYDPAYLPLAAALARGDRPPPRPRVTLPRRPPCYAREECGCLLPECHDPGRAAAFGRPEVQVLASRPEPRTVYRVGYADCERCGGLGARPADAATTPATPPQDAAP